MLLKIVASVWCVVVFSILISALNDLENSSSSCTQIDFDEATISSLRKCDYKQEFVAKRYDDSNHFDPYRPDAVYYLSHRWQGLTCGETVDTYSFNEETELRMAYNLVFDSGAKLEVRVFDEDRIDSDNKPTLVEVWHTEMSTEGWALFREKLNKTVKKARIQIEANMNAGSDLAIEYLTIFNYEVETEECSNIDEFSTTEVVISSTTTSTTETTTQQPVTTTPPLDTTMTTTAETFSTTTMLSTDDDETATTTEISSEATTVTADATTTTTTSTVASSTTERLTTTTTNAPRDDTSVQSSTSTTQQPSFSDTTIQTTDNPKSTTIFTTTESASSIVETLSSKQWLWMTLSAVFAILFLLATSVAIYLCHINRHLGRISTRLVDEVGHYPYKKM